jgi:hypothetical protein
MAGEKHTPNTQWNDKRTEQAFELALLGYTDKQIAEEMGVHPMTFDYWKRTKPEFFARLNEGKAEADQKVVNAFYQNCLDRWVEEEEVHMYKDKPIIVKRRRFIPGDKWAQAKWLALRQRNKWSEVQRTEITQTNVNINKLDFSGFTEEEKRMLYSIGIKQLTQNIGNS